MRQRRFCARRGSKDFYRQEIIAEELDQIVKDTRSKGETPDQTLTATLEKLRDLGEVEFVNNRGHYRLLLERLEFADADAHIVEQVKRQVLTDVRNNHARAMEAKSVQAELAQTLKRVKSANKPKSEEEAAAFAVIIAKIKAHKR